jgi:hypothetical protein
LNPLLTWASSAAWLADHHLTLGARYDTLVTVSNESPRSLTESTMTFGAAWSYRRIVTVQVNGLHRATEDPVNPDLKDDAVLVNVQLAWP